MKKYLLITCPILIILVFIIIYCIDFNLYNKQTKTISLDNNGLILSISTSDGKSETKPFLKSYGHTWLSLDNQTDHSIYIKDYEIKQNELLTFSVWAISGESGVYYNLEANFINELNRYDNRKSLSANIDESKLDIINSYIDNHNEWSLVNNCSRWSIGLWNELVDDNYKLKTQPISYTPKKIQNSFSEFKDIETNKDFTRAKKVFFYKDNTRTEMKLCS